MIRLSEKDSFCLVGMEKAELSTNKGDNRGLKVVASSRLHRSLEVVHAIPN